MKHFAQQGRSSASGLLYCFLWRRFYAGSHDWADIALFLVVVRLMAHGNFLLLNSAPQLAIGVLVAGAVYRLGVVPENLPYRMEQAVYRQDGGGQERTILPLQQNLCVGVALLRRLGQPVHGLFHVLGDALTLPVELAQQVFGVGVVSFRRHCEPGQGLRRVPSFQQFFAETIGCIRILALSGLSQPVDTLLPVVDFYIIGQQQFAQGVLCVRQLPRRLPEPIPRLQPVWREQGAVPVQLAQEELGVGIAALCLRSKALHPFITQIQWEAAVTDH